MRFRSGSIRLLDGDRVQVSGEELRETCFLGSWLAGQLRDECGIAIGKTLQGGDHVGEFFEAEHAFGAPAELTGSLRAAQQKDADDGCLGAREIENFLKVVLVLRNPRVGAASRARETEIMQCAECVPDGVLIEVHHGLAVVLLIAGIDECVEGQRVVLGGRHVLFNK